MSLLRMIDATLRVDAQNAVGPLNITLEPGEAASLAFATPREAVVAARLAAALVKATSGTVLIGDFDPKVQPVQAKRLVGYVPADPPSPPFKNVDDYFRFRADLWEIEREEAVQRAHAILALCGEPASAYAKALAGALIRPCALLVLDQPELEYVRIACRERSAGAAVLTTHATQAWRDTTLRELLVEYREAVAP